MLPIFTYMRKLRLEIGNLDSNGFCDKRQKKDREETRKKGIENASKDDSMAGMCTAMAGGYKLTTEREPVRVMIQQGGE